MTSALTALLLLCAMGCGNHTAVKGVLDSAEAPQRLGPEDCGPDKRGCGCQSEPAE